MKLKRISCEASPAVQFNFHIAKITFNTQHSTFKIIQKFVRRNNHPTRIT